jgi:hypothetical protein
LYEGNTIVAHGSEMDMATLKQTIKELISDRSIKQIISEYDELVNRLAKSRMLERLNLFAREMHTKIHGRAILGGYPACDLCDPDVPADVTIEIGNPVTSKQNSDIGSTKTY